MKKINRILSVVLTVTMLVTMLPSAVFAVESDSKYEAESVTEADAVSGQEIENGETAKEVPEEKTDDEKVQDTVGSEQMTDSSEESGSEEAGKDEVPSAEENQTTEEPAEETDSAKAPEEQNVNFLEVEKDDYVVTISYDDKAGVPQNARISVEEIRYEDDHKLYDDYVKDAADAIDSQAESLTYVKLLDISIVDEKDNKVDLTGPVDVQIRLKDVKQVDDTTQVVHFAGEEEIPEVIEPDVDGNTVAFETEGFSVYAVVGEDDEPGYEAVNQRLTVKLFTNPTDAETAAEADADEDEGSDQLPHWGDFMYVKKADLPTDDMSDTEKKAALERFNSILYDPGYPESTANKQYSGWKEWTEDDTGETFTTIDQFRNHVKTLLEDEDGVSEGDCIYLYPVFTFRLHFEDENGAIFTTKFVDSDGEECSWSKFDEVVYEAKTPDTAFQYWVKKEENPASSTTIRYGSAANLTNTITFSEDITLVPILVDGYRVIFDENDGGAGIGGASYTPETVVPFGEFPDKPTDPSRPGYSFLGWYTNPTPVNEDGIEGKYTDWSDPDGHGESAVPYDAELHLYAHWKPEMTQYKVVIWTQKIDDLVTFTDAEKGYVPAGSFTGSAPSETLVAGLLPGDEGLLKRAKDQDCLAAPDLGYKSEGFVYADKYDVENGWDDNKKINGQGNTVINLYYNRSVMRVVTVKRTTKADNNDHSDDLFGYVNRGDGNQYYSPLTVVEGVDRYGNPTYTFYDLDGNQFTGTRVRVKEVEEKMRGLYGQPLSLYNYTWPGIVSDNQYTSYYRDNQYGSEYYVGPSACFDLRSFTGTVFVNNNCYIKPYNRYDDLLVYCYYEDLDGEFKLFRKITYLEWQRYFKLDVLEGFEPVGYIFTERGSDHDQPVPTGMPKDSDWQPCNADSTIYRTQGHHEPAILQIKFVRRQNKLTFKNLYTNRSWEVEGIKFGENVSNHENRFPTSYEVRTSGTGVPSNYYYEEGAWYLDPEFKVKADLSTLKMGKRDITLYARVEPKEFHVRVFYDNGQSEENFWVDYGTKLSHSKFTKVTKPGYTLVGFYKDPGFKEKWNWNDPVDDTKIDGKPRISYLYDDTNGSDPLREGYPEGNDYPTDPKTGNKLWDKGYDGTVGVLTLYARWYDGFGGYKVKYVTPTKDGGTKELSLDQNRRYELGKEIVLADAPDENESWWPVDGNGKKQRFAGWILKSESNPKSPGQHFNAELDYADDDEPVYDEELGRYIYTITVTARYVDREEKNPTHIYFYMNYYKPDPDEEPLTGDGIYFDPDHKKYDAVQINKAYEVPGLNEDDWTVDEVPERTGYEFLGWARMPEGDAVNGVLPVEEKDLYIRYDKVKNEYDICEVAADERDPYQGFFAVWAKEITFTVFHPDVPGAAKQTVKSYEGKVTDLTGYVTKDEEGKALYLYGGYRTEQEGKLVGDTRGDSSSTPIVPGTRVVPKDGDTFYLKEVDRDYMKPQIFITYYKNYAERRITGTYGLINIDDAFDYKEIYLTNTDGDEVKNSWKVDKVCSEIYFLHEGEEKSEANKLSYQNIFNNSLTCESALINLGIDFKNPSENVSKELNLETYFVTWDNIQVQGTRARAVDFGTGCYEDWKKPGITATLGPHDAEPKMKDLNEPPQVDTDAGSSGSGQGIIKAGSGVIRDVSWKKQYTVTKMDGSESTVQTVSEGNCTGQIEYDVKSDSMFAGWYLDKACKKPADFSNVTGDMTVYAKYINKSDISFSLARTGGLIGNVPFEAVVSVKAAAQPDNIEVCFVKGTDTVDAALTTTVKENIGTKKKPVYLYKHKGSAKLANTRISDAFTAQVIWTTPDGTRVEGEKYTVQYEKGIISLQQ